MKKEEINRDQSAASQFPHFNVKFEPENGHTLCLSTGDQLELGKVHPALMEHLFTTVKTINRLAHDPTMISYERLKDEFGE
ncbi:MAG: hypothetical protein JJ892_11940 [Balneola sp.]|nr:hypothetical protein [Balneola sp.]MBO6651436.1 hypothetical protein [Balneola sp.]MBO6712527.1 hypothetical protein [Balneola sp.]MBO6800980.1 hypothetical protein [Balneola sp.]MBO6870652.1 hypothetical protein [Balneola sp.]